MEEYLNKGIKEIIDQFPEAIDILNDYNIGCAPCNVGTCLFKDIVNLHNLSPEDEKQLFSRIAKVIYPDREIEIPKLKTEKKIVSNGFSYSPPIKRLVDEHKLIKRLLALIPFIIKNPDFESQEWENMIRGCVNFIRSYADKYHHAKEEDILFKYFDENLDIIQIMHKDHKTGREHVKSILEGLEQKNSEKIVRHFCGYAELLTEHIKKEDEILYIWMDKNLSTSQIGSMFAKFNEVENRFGDSPNEYKKFIISLENKFNFEEETK